MLILTAADVGTVLDPGLAFTAVQDCFQDIAAGKIAAFARHQLSAGPDRALMGLMPVTGTAPGAPWAVKIVTVNPSNPAQGLDSHQGFVLLANGQTGVPEALIDASVLTATRTAAASAVATVALAAPNPARIAILGGGTQARSHVAAFAHLYPLAEIALWSRRGAAPLAEELGVTACTDLAQALHGASVICTVTAAPTPILSLDDVALGVHVNAVGASRADRREISADLIAAAERFVDSAAQAETECGEFLLAQQDGVIGPGPAATELSEVIAGRHPGRSGPQAITLFKSLGIAAEDLATAVAVVRRATSQGIGTVLNL
jgi:ornithine cyclodeaminase/alanine dehydrogenase-like protein (mu-crystallin family)